MSEVMLFFQKGGILMIPIVAFSVVALAVFLERAWVLRRERVVPTEFVQLIQRKIGESKPAEALTLCEASDSSISAILASGLRRHGQGRAQIKEVFEEVGRVEVTHLGRFVEVMGTIAAVAPLVGLLGTVVGMIDVFRAVVSDGAGPVNPATLASGIWTALLTTAAGLAVAIPAYIGYRYQLSRVDRLALEMEEVTLHTLDLLEPVDLEPVVQQQQTDNGQ